MRTYVYHAYATLCEKYSIKIVTENFAKCPSCRKPTEKYTKIFFKQRDFVT